MSNLPDEKSPELARGKGGAGTEHSWLAALEEGIDAQIIRVFENLKAVAEAAGGQLSDIVKVNVYLTDLAHFSRVNEVMTRYFAPPYPARAAVGVKELPRGALVEADAVLVKRQG